jgi:hypothetical protein
MTDTATIRTRLRQIIRHDLRAMPRINATLVADAYARQYGSDDRVHRLAADELERAFDPAGRALRRMR